jgi:ribosome-associated protein
MIPAMSRRPAPGRTPAREVDAAYDEDGRPSKSQKKRESQELQVLGQDLTEMPASRVATLGLPESLNAALEEFRKTRSHEGRRRQLQFIGKLMRQVDAEPLREAVAAYKLGGAQDALLLHQVERWRSLLVGQDTAVTDWMLAFPDSDAQQLRALIRQARSDSREDAAAGAATRQGRSFRELFKFIKSHLQA